MNNIFFVSLAMLLPAFWGLSMSDGNQEVVGYAGTLILLGIPTMFVGFFKTIKKGIFYLLMVLIIAVMFGGTSIAIAKISTWGLWGFVLTFFVVGVLYELQRFFVRDRSKGD